MPVVIRAPVLCCISPSELVPASSWPKVRISTSEGTVSLLSVPLTKLALGVLHVHVGLGAVSLLLDSILIPLAAAPKAPLD